MSSSGNNGEIFSGQAEASAGPEEHTGSPDTQPADAPDTTAERENLISESDLERVRALARTGRREEAIALCRQWAATNPRAAVLLAEILTDPEHHVTTRHTPSVRTARNLLRLSAGMILVGIGTTGALIKQMCPPESVMDGLCPPWVPAGIAFGVLLSACLVLGWYHAAIYRIARWRDLADAPIRAIIGSMGDALLLSLPLLGPWLAVRQLRMLNDAGRDTGYGLNAALWLMFGQILLLALSLGLLLS
ncbi:MAG TPA: hypothetical protein PLO53_04195 [Candidatus Hydrogenedentes bacterium]|nr:hypothetical protein [Candidatus Hydrogenedentota bacterium]